MSTYSYALVIDEGPLQGTRYPVPPQGGTLGRASQCDIVIKDLLLSRSHCRFEQRGDDLWVIDLASANQTLVNQAPVDEKMLAPGDIVQVGQTTLRVERTSAAAAAADASADSADAASPSDMVIDLGFGKDDDTGQHAKKSFLRPVIWTIGAVLVLIIGTVLILDSSSTTKTTAVKSLTDDQDKTILLSYEKIEADTDNVFRYALNLTPDGMLSVMIDDLSGQNRHVRKEKKVPADLLAELVRDVENSGFFSLDKSYTGFASHPNQLNEWTLTAVIGVKAHTCRVTNRQEPEGFRALREKLETFSKNELGIWAIQFSTEKLTELARDTLAMARKKFDERDVRFGNLYDSIRNYQEAVFYLDTVNPKPDFYAEIIDGFEAAEKELGTRYDEQRFQANRAINTKEWQEAARTLKIIREMIPDTADSRNKEATQKLLDVENRLKKSR